MDTAQKLSVLDSKVEKFIQRQARKRTEDRKKALYLKVVSVILAAMVTILLGLEGLGPLETLFKNIALIFGASITIVNTVDAFFDFRGLWIRRTVFLSKLYDLKLDIELCLTGTEPNELDLDTVEEFRNRHNEILNEDLKEWLKLRKKSE